MRYGNRRITLNFAIVYITIVIIYIVHINYLNNCIYPFNDSGVIRKSTQLMIINLHYFNDR